MGIPSFFRWISDRYPRCIVRAREEPGRVVNGVTFPVDTTRRNPNGIEFDNLYLDMNGIIHPCFHPEGMDPPKTFDEVFMAIFEYIDRVFSIIRPRKLLFMAIDGVAPRAKMNQQRTRRFRAAKELSDKVSAKEKLLGVSKSEPEEVDNDMLDSNIITPGTEFMELLSSALRYYIHLRMNNDPGWKGIKVILSDATVPGEGEHKIVSYIRLQRNLPGFDPNTHHCLYGLDADLIMLALATHEIHFTILREDLLGSHNGNQSSNARGKGGKKKEGSSELKFQLVRIWVLRDYLAHELQIPDPTVNVDFERLIDDFIFLCLFVGNDFLPHIPSLEIREGAIDSLMMVYKKEFVKMGGYLTKSSEVNLERVEHFIKAIGSYEIPIFKKRIQDIKGRKKFLQHLNSKVKLGEEGWKERYYTVKFEVNTDDDRERIRQHSVSKYVEGICWVMHYYYQGICSWQWFYPYHYAPFASDFQGLGQLDIQFTLGKPFKPLDQLMGVLPAASAQALPFFYRKLMTDPSSPILDFYPSDFKVDLNGRRHAWQGVCKLPFIEECRLLAEIEKVEHTLTDEEKRRNSRGLDLLFVYETHPLAAQILSFSEQNIDDPELPEAKVKINPEFSQGMNGYMTISKKSVYPAEINSPINKMEMIKKNKVISVFYEVPSFHPHIPKLPEGVIMPGKLVGKHDIRPPAIPWHEKTAIIEGRVSSRFIHPGSISGACLAKVAHRLVSETCIANRGTNKDHSEIGKRKREDEVELTKSWKKRLRKRENKMNKVQSSCENHGEVGKRENDGEVKLTKNQKKHLRKKISKMKKLQSSGENHFEMNKVLSCESHGETVKGDPSHESHNEMKMVQVSCENHGDRSMAQSSYKNYSEVGKREKDDGEAELIKSQKRRLRSTRSKMKKDQSSGEKNVVMNKVLPYEIHGEINEVQASHENHIKAKDVQASCENHEMNMVLSCENHCEVGKRENDGEVELTKNQKKRLRNRRNKMEKVQSSGKNHVEMNKVLPYEINGETNKVQLFHENHSEMIKIQASCENQGAMNRVQSSCESHGEVGKRENDGKVELTNKTTTMKVHFSGANNVEMNKVLPYEIHGETHKVQPSHEKRSETEKVHASSCENPGEVGKRENNGEVEVAQTGKKRRRNKASTMKVQSSGANPAEMNKVLPHEIYGETKEVQPHENNSETEKVHASCETRGEVGKRENNGEVELTQSRKRRRRNKTSTMNVQSSGANLVEMNKVLQYEIHGETSKVQPSHENHSETEKVQASWENRSEMNVVQSCQSGGEVGKKENDCEAELTQSRKKRRKNKTSIMKVQSSGANHVEMNKVLPYRIHGDTNKVHSPNENHGEMKVVLTCENSGPMDKVLSPCLNHGEVGKRDKYGEVELSKAQKKRQRQRNKRNTMEGVHPSGENHGDINKEATALLETMVR